MNGMTTRNVKVGGVLKSLGVAALMLVVAGCSSSDHGQLRSDIDEVKKTPPGRIAPLPEFQTYETYVYTSAEGRDPFVPKEEARITAGGGATNGIRPNVNRHKEALEQFPLDGLQYVGLLERAGDMWAIIKAPDNLVYRAKVGNHMGQNFGKVVSISEGSVKLVEIIPDGLGGWIEREAGLAIIE